MAKDDFSTQRVRKNSLQSDAPTDGLSELSQNYMNYSDECSSDTPFDYELEIDEHTIAEIGTIAKRQLIKESVDNFIKFSKKTKVIQKINGQRDKVQSKIRNQKKRVRSLMQSAPFWRTADKLGFVIGTLVLVSFSYMIGKFPNDHFYTYYFYVTMLMLAVRVAHYYHVGWHYFITDFCYYANALILYLIVCDSKNEQLIKICFLYS